MTDYLTAEEVLAVHDRHCGGPGTRDAGAVAAAAARPQATVFGEDAYGSDFEKAAALLHSLARSHPFVDGNKRCAWLCARVFLARNGHPPLPVDAEESAAFVVAVAVGRYESVAAIASELVKFFR